MTTISDLGSSGSRINRRFPTADLQLICNPLDLKFEIS